MTAADRDALRIALAFAGALVAAEAMNLELTFVAPLVAGTLAITPQRPTTLLALPVVTWLLAALAVLLAQSLFALPLVLAVVLLGLFTLGFAASSRPTLAAIGLLALVTFAIILDTLARYPEASPEIMGWMVRNVAIAAGCTWLAEFLLPRTCHQRLAPQHAPPQPRDGLPPIVAACVLLLAVVGVWAAQPTAAAPILLSVIIMLRAEGGSPQGAGLARLLGALAGGAVAVVVAGLVEVSPTLPVLALATLAGAWLIARRIIAGGRWQGAASKSLNAMAILQGQGLSELYDDTGERFWIRLGGVLVGLALATLALWLLNGQLSPSAASDARPGSCPPRRGRCSSIG